MQVKLEQSGYEVELLDKLNFGQYMDIQGVMNIKVSGADTAMQGNELMTGMRKVLELAVVKITKDGKEEKYSEQWLYGLELEDGLQMIEAAKSLLSKKK